MPIYVAAPGLHFVSFRKLRCLAQRVLSSLPLGLPSRPPLPLPLLPPADPAPDLAIASDVREVASRSVIAGGVTAANLPHVFRNSRRSSSSELFMVFNPQLPDLNTAPKLNQLILMRFQHERARRTSAWLIDQWPQRSIGLMPTAKPTLK